MNANCGDELEAASRSWPRRHLLDIESLTAAEISTLLNTAVALKNATGNCARKLPLLAGRTVANLFFENSTRTKTSFSLAARRLGADTVDFSTRAAASPRARP